MSYGASARLLDRLLATLEVHAKAIALCEAGLGWSMALDPAPLPLFHYVLRGSGSLHVEGSGSFALAPFDVVLVPPARAQRLEHGPARNEVRGMEHRRSLASGLMAMSTPATASDAPAAVLVTACGLIEATYGGAFGLFEGLSQPVAVRLPANDSLRAGMDAMVRELVEPQVGAQRIVDALMAQCVVLLVRKLWDAHGEQATWLLGRTDPRLLRAVAVVIGQPDADHTLLALAKEAGMSRSTFAARFALTFGRSPMAFVRDLRLRRAARLLKETEMPVADVARTVGFDSRSYFSRAFRSAYGEDPQSFRGRAKEVGNQGT